MSQQFQPPFWEQKRLTWSKQPKTPYEIDAGDQYTFEEYSEQTIIDKINNIDRRIAQKTASLIKSGDGNYQNKKRVVVKWLIYALAALVAVGIIAAALLTPLSFLLVGSVITGAAGLALANYTMHAANRMRTLGRGVALGATGATVALLVKHVHGTDLLSGVGGFLLPISIVAGISAFISNLVLYRNDVPAVLSKIVNSLNPRNWQRPQNIRQSALTAVNRLVDLAITSLSLATGYLLTASMIYSFVTVFSFTIMGVSVLTAPFIIVPLAILAFIGNTAFMQRGLQKIKRHFIDAWQYNFTAWENTSPSRFKRMTYYFLNWTPKDSKTRKSVKVFIALLKLASLGLIAYFSQVPMVKELISGMKWASHFIVFTWLTPMMQAITMQSMIARVAVTYEKTVIVATIVARWLKFKCTKKENRDPEVQKQYEDMKNNRRPFKQQCQLYMMDDDAKKYWQQEFDDEWQTQEQQEAKLSWDNYCKDKNETSIGGNWRKYYEAESERRWEKAGWYRKAWASAKAIIAKCVDVLMVPAVVIAGSANGVLSFDGEASASSAEKAIALLSSTGASMGITGVAANENKKQRAMELGNEASWQEKANGPDDQHGNDTHSSSSEPMDVPGDPPLQGSPTVSL